MTTWLTDGGSLPEPQELDHSVTENWETNLEEFTASASLSCLWEHRHATMYNILANAKAWPYHEDELMYATGGRIIPFPGNKSQEVSGFTGGLAYDKAQLDIDFKVVTLVPETKALYSEELAVNDEMIALPHYHFQWGDDTYEPRAWLYSGEPKTQKQLDKLEEQASFDAELLEPNPNYNKVDEDEAPTRILGGYDYVVNWFNLVNIPSAIGLVNHINEDEVYAPSLNFTFGPETLRLGPCRTSRTVSFGGANRYTLEARFAYRVEGWNNFWRVREMAYNQQYFKGTNIPYFNYPTSSGFLGLVP